MVSRKVSSGDVADAAAGMAACAPGAAGAPGPGVGATAGSALYASGAALSEEISAAHNRLRRNMARGVANESNGAEVLTVIPIGIEYLHDGVRRPGGLLQGICSGGRA